MVMAWIGKAVVIPWELSTSHSRGCTPRSTKVLVVA